MVNYNTITKLTAFIFPSKIDRDNFRYLGKSIETRKKLNKMKFNYPNLIKKFKEEKRSHYKVLFLINEISKWKMQSLYDLMDSSEHFEPVIALTISDFQKKLTKEKQVEILRANYEYFNQKGMKCVYAYDFNKFKPKSLEEFQPQIVFYQQPWEIAECQMPFAVSEFALTCYVPYYVQNYGNFRMEADKELHKSVWKYYILNKDWEALFNDHMTDNISKITGLGHPMLDVFYKNKEYTGTKDYVIYAPHWSIEHEKNYNTENYSTFLKNGKEILEYAKKHPEINWVFKPHPTLKYTLLRTGVMNEEEVKNYYMSWEEIADSCYNSDYPKLFLESKALITDCGSFLTEYFCTGKPIIHLISSTCKNHPMLPSKKYFDTFYQVHNLDEMYKCFEEIIIKDNDIKKPERLNMLKQCGFTDNYAAGNILEDLTKDLMQ